MKMVKYQMDMMCEKIWDKFEMKNMGDYHDHYIKKCITVSRCI